VTPALRSELLGERLTAIDEALTHIRQGQRAHAEAQNARGWLMDILDLVPRDPGLDAAVDDLHRSICAFVEAEPSTSGRQARRVRLLSEAYSRLLDRLRAVGVSPSSF
jgi:hypothetical protein